MTRQWTIKLLEAMDDGAIDPKVVAEMCLQYMSEDDVADMCATNDIFQEDEDVDDQDS